MRTSTRWLPWLAGLLLFSLCPMAAAHPHDPAATDSLVASQRLRSVSELGLPTPGGALAVGITATLVPIAILAASPSAATGTLAAAGVVAGPAVGFAYGGVGARGGRGAALRALLTVASVLWLGAAFEQEDEVPALMAVAASGLVVGSAAWDLATLPGHVARENERVLRARLTGSSGTGERLGVALAVEHRGR